MKRFWITLAVLIIVVGGGFAIWWFASGQQSNTPATPTTSANQTATKNTIRANWVKFFNGTTPAATKISLLENGQQYAQVIDAQAGSPTAKATAASVSNVQVNGNAASVTYSITVNKQPALTNQTGQAVYQDGSWKVSDAAFCSLLRLSDSVPPNCPSPSSSQTNQ